MIKLFGGDGDGGDYDVEFFDFKVWQFGGSGNVLIDWFGVDFFGNFVEQIFGYVFIGVVFQYVEGCVMYVGCGDDFVCGFDVGQLVGMCCCVKGQQVDCCCFYGYVESYVVVFCWIGRGVVLVCCGFVFFRIRECWVDLSYGFGCVCYLFFVVSVIGIDDIVVKYCLQCGCVWFYLNWGYVIILVSSLVGIVVISVLLWISCVVLVRLGVMQWF